MAIHPIFIQTFGYAIAMSLGLFFIGFLQMGFLWKYLKVKVSWGKKVLVKIRGIDKDFFAVGQVIEGFLVYGRNKEEKRVSIDNRDAFYKVMGTSWVDVDDEKNCVIKPDTTVVKGYDAVKYNNLYLRALYSPQISSLKEKLIIGLLVAVLIMVIICVLITYFQSEQLLAMQGQINALKDYSQQAIQQVNI